MSPAIDRRIRCNGQMKLIPGMQGQLNNQKSMYIIYPISRIKDKNKHNYLNSCRKNILKLQHPFIKTSSKTGTEEHLLNLLEGIFKGNLKVNVERQYIFSNIWNKVRISGFPILLNIVN